MNHDAASSVDAGLPAAVAGAPGATGEGATRPALSPAGRAAVVVLSVLAVLLMGVCVALALHVKGERDAQQAADEARGQALVSARQAILNLDSLSAATIDRDLERVVDGATGTFKEEFSKAQVDLKKLIVERKTVSSGEIRSAGVVRADSDTATVLVAVDRTVKDSTNATGVVARDRWKVDLEKRGGHWLVADLQPVS